MRPRTFLVPLILAAAPAAGAQTAFTSLDVPSANTGGVVTFGYNLRSKAEPFRITHLGAFDDGKNGFARDITVSVATGAGQSVSSLVFSGAAGSPVGAFRFLALATPIDIAPNTQFQLYASGYGAGEQSYNVFLPPNVPLPMLLDDELAIEATWWVGESGSGGVRGGDVAPVLGGPNFIASVAVTATPEPATVTLVGAGVLALGLRARSVRRRRRAAA